MSAIDIALYGIIAVFVGVLVLWFLFRSEEHTSELQSQSNLVCRLLLEKKKKAFVLATAETPAPACLLGYSRTGSGGAFVTQTLALPGLAGVGALAPGPVRLRNAPARTG